MRTPLPTTRLLQIYLRFLCDDDVEVSIGMNEVGILISSYCYFDAHQTMLLNEMERMRNDSHATSIKTVNVRQGHIFSP